MADPALRRALLEFEIALDVVAADEVREEDWGRAFLTPSLPLVWDASYIALERAGLAMVAVADLADAVLGAAGFAHRTVVVVGESEGRRLAEEAEAEPGWEAERTRYMAWRETDPGTDAQEPAVRTEGSDPGRSANGPTAAGARGTPAVREASMATVEPLRQRLQAEMIPTGQEDAIETTNQLIELDRRLGEGGGDRWFFAPAKNPAAVCRLLRDGQGIGQVEDVATLEDARGQGLASAVVNVALAASRQAGDTTTFITADAADWPQFFYERLGFVPIGDLHVLRYRPTT